MTRLLFYWALALILANACAKREDADSHSEGRKNGEETNSQSESDKKEETCTAIDLPSVPVAAGQLQFTLSEDIDPCSVSGYVVGKQSLLSVQRTKENIYVINNVPPGHHDIIVTGSLPLGLQAQSKERGVRLGQLEFLAGVTTNKGQIDLPEVGSITGTAKLQHGQDHAGIRAYIPGTGFDATTDSNGNYTISPYVVAGVQNLYFEKDGYHRGQIEKLMVESSAETKAQEISLALSTGAAGFIQIQGGLSIYNALTVQLTIGATSNAILMKVSESSAFENKDWIPVVTTLSYTFSTEGSKRLYVKFSDANGLESSPYYSDIIVDMTAPSITDSAITSIPYQKSIVLSWSEAVDNTADSEDLTYSIYKSESNNISSIASAVSNGILVHSSKNLTSYRVTGLSVDTTYYFSIVVKDSLDHSSIYSTTSDATNETISSVSGGGAEHTCAITSSGGVKCWGNNQWGQLGNGTTIDSLIPASVSGLTSGVVALSVGYGSTCALTSLGGVKCWGNNQEGELGDGTGITRLTPVDVSGLTGGVTAISSSTSHWACALTSSGGVKCWGANGSGQLGDGTTTRRLTPVDVLGLTSGVNAILTIGSTSCALTTSGGVKCWGSNQDGLVGDGTTTNRSTPVDVSGLTSGVSAIKEGGLCALTSLGGVKCWGPNYSGNIGDGTTTTRLSPVDVFSLTSGVDHIIAGAWSSSCALTSAGLIKCWGDNSWGQLGDGTTTNRSLPFESSFLEGGISDVSFVAKYGCGITESGGIKCWGLNDKGQLGDGTTTDRLNPVDVVGLSD